MWLLTDLPQKLHAFVVCTWYKGACRISTSHLYPPHLLLHVVQEFVMTWHPQHTHRKNYNLHFCPSGSLNSLRSWYFIQTTCVSIKQVCLISAHRQPVSPVGAELCMITSEGMRGGGGGVGNGATAIWFMASSFLQRHTFTFIVSVTCTLKTHNVEQNEQGLSQGHGLAFFFKHGKLCKNYRDSKEVPCTCVSQPSVIVLFDPSL